MNTTIQFLKARLKELKTRLEQSADYREIQILEKYLSEFAPHPVETKKRNIEGSPVSKFAHGERTRAIYRAISQIVRSYGGAASIENIRQKLKEEHGMEFDQKNRFTSYVFNYNSKHPTDVTLQLVSATKGGLHRKGKIIAVRSVRRKKVETKKKRGGWKHSPETIEKLKMLAQARVQKKRKNAA